MTKKMTKKEMFAEIIAMAKGEKLTNAIPQDIVDFAQHEIELLENKSSKSGPTKTQKENELLIAQLEEALAEFDRPVTVTEFMKESPSSVATLSNQKLSSLLKKCVDERKTVVRTMEKKHAYFSLVRE